MKKNYFKYILLFLFISLFFLLLPGPNGLIQCVKREKEVKRLEKEILDLKIEGAIKKLKIEILKKSIGKN